MISLNNKYITPWNKIIYHLVMSYSWIQTMLFERFQLIHLIQSFAGNFSNKFYSQVAHSSIYGLMCGYTNFVCGHFALRNGMVPIPEMMDRRNKYQLRP